jgi:hypothetical protein
MTPPTRVKTLYSPKEEAEDVVGRTEGVGVGEVVMIDRLEKPAQSLTVSSKVKLDEAIEKRWKGVTNRHRHLREK